MCVIVTCCAHFTNSATFLLLNAPSRLNDRVSITIFLKSLSTSIPRCSSGCSQHGCMVSKAIQINPSNLICHDKQLQIFKHISQSNFLVQRSCNFNCNRKNEVLQQSCHDWLSAKKIVRRIPKISH